jgi:hypothetical protein
MVKINSFYYSTDTNILSFSNGVAWTQISTPGGAESFGTSLPSSPADGQRHVLVDSTSNPSYQWLMRYNSAEATYKWECIGGSFYAVSVETEEAPGSSGAWVNLATGGPSLTTPYSGDWDVLATCNLVNSAGSSQALRMGITSGDTTPSTGNDIENSVANGLRQLVSVFATVTGVSSGASLKMRYQAVASTSTAFGQRRMRIRPRRLI